MTPTDAPYSRTYHLSPLRLWSLPLVYAVLMVLIIWAGLTSSSEIAPGSGAVKSDREVMLALAGFLTVIFLPFCALLWQSRLVVTHLGIAHHQFGYTVRSTWQNLIGLRLESYCEALILKEPGTRSKLLRFSAKAVGGALPGAEGVIGDPDALGAGRLINLTPFMSHWSRGTLERDVRRFAPHLFEPTNAR